MSSLHQTADQVLKVIHFRVGGDARVHDESPLFEGGLGLDSIAFLELLLEIEESTGKRLRNETLTEDAVATVGSLIKYVDSLEQV